MVVSKSDILTGGNARFCVLISYSLFHSFVVSVVCCAAFDVCDVRRQRSVTVTAAVSADSSVEFYSLAGSLFSYSRFDLSLFVSKQMHWRSQGNTGGAGPPPGRRKKNF